MASPEGKRVRESDRGADGEGALFGNDRGTVQNMMK
jgi:hypothetical protein